MIGAAGLVAPAILTGCANENKQTPLRQEGEYYVPELPDKAVEGRELKVGVVGCGGRGSGAVINLLDAADGITVTALGDVFQQGVQAVGTGLSLPVPAQQLAADLVAGCFDLKCHLQCFVWHSILP